MKAYHFTSDTLRDGSPIPAIGEWLEFNGEVKICKSGLHYSEHPFNALQYAPGNLLHLVEVEDIVEEQEDKGVCRRRKIIKTIDAEDILRQFARKCALDVIHLWDAPPIVREYLETGNEELRAAAWDAAGAAITRDAAWAAAWAAAGAAGAAGAAARNAALAAAGAAARAAAGAAAGAAARAAAWDSQRKHFKALVNKTFKEGLQ